MTAKEIREKILEHIYVGNAEFAEELLMQYDVELCREQREICANQVSGWPLVCKLESEIEDDVLNAPMPEL